MGGGRFGGGGGWFEIRQVQEFYVFSKIVQTGCAAHPASHSSSTGEIRLTSHLNVASKLGMNRVVPSLLLYAFIAWTRTSLALPD